MTTARGPVAVGIDDSSGTSAALAWALDEARSRGVPVRLVHAFGWALTQGAIPIYGNLPVPELAHVRRVAEKLLADTAATAAGLAPDVDVSTHALGDDAVPTLIEESRTASTVVLGSRHLGAAGSMFLGSVGAAVSARASCPVVVVRGPSGFAAEGAAVVVGVDALDDAAAALEYGFEVASRKSLPLRAVLCWRRDVLAEMMWRPEPEPPERAEALLSQTLAGWREKYPDVDVHGAVVRDHPVAGLVAASNAQHLLVVGARGRHAIAGALLGSVSQGVLHHATCPVAVVHLPPA
jgi:nucleotide-binding universal stress UspA family protein